VLRIRFQRKGKRNQPFFRIIVIERKSPPKGGRPLEILGFFNPLTKEKKLKKERINYWISKGAQLSDTIHNLLVKEQIIKAKKISVHSTKKSKKEILPAVSEEASKETPEVANQTKAAGEIKAAKETEAKEKMKEEPKGQK